jgi:hypothetical protein
MRYYGIVADRQYSNWNKIDGLIASMRPREDVLLTVPYGGVAPLLKTRAEKKNLFFYFYDPPSWDDKRQSVNDEMFLHYLRLHRGKLWLFPHKYNTHTYGLNYSKRMQDFVIQAHLLKVRYEIVSEDHDPDSVDSSGGGTQ